MEQPFGEDKKLIPVRNNSRFYIYRAVAVIGLPPNTDNVVPFDTLVFDTLGECTLGAAARFTPRLDGYYLLHARVYGNNLLVGRNFDLNIRDQVGAFICSHRTVAVSTNHHNQVTMVRRITPPQFVDVATREGIALDPNYNLAGGYGYTMFCGHRLS